jgi:hypothetical protein
VGRGRGFRGKSGFGDDGKSLHLLELGPTRLGQPCPHQYPHPGDTEIEASPESLGVPLTINEVARLIGCSVWTVRQRYLPAGLPHLRLRPNGKLYFYKNKIIQWLLAEQQKGGIRL